MADKTIVIWGAGRIGRGFVADLFKGAGYGLVLVDQSPKLVAMLRERAQYTVVCAEGPGRRIDHVVDGYGALATTERDALAAALVAADLVAVAVFPRDFEAVAAQMAPGLALRAVERPDAALDILLCTNLAHAAPSFRGHLEAALPVAMRAYGDRQIGVVETLVIRMVVEPPAEEVASDPLIVWTNGYAELPVDRLAFRGAIPDLPFLRPVADMRAEEMRKLFTYNTYHAALAYLGALRGHETIMACIEDPAVRREAEGALAESRAAVQATCGFSDGEMVRWIDGVLSQTANPALGDTVARFAADPLRKLRRGDRLVGPLLLAHGCGIATPYLERAVAAALLYDDPADAGARAMHERIAALGIPGAVSVLCELAPHELPLVDLVAHAYTRLQREIAWAEKARRGAELAYDLEKTYHGCGQCAVAALLDTLETLDPCAGDALFEAATGVAGGLGLSGDAACGALTGSALVFGALYPRRRANFGGDRENKYRTYGMVQRLRQRYLEAYGGITCHDVHRSIFGRAFDLQDPQDRIAFEAAGAHEDKCTGVVARAVRWAIEIIAEEQMAADGLLPNAEAVPDRSPS